MKGYRLQVLITSLFLFVSLLSQVSEDELKKHVEILASPEFEGRGLNTKGIRKAELYILQQISKFNLAPGNTNSYRQEFSFYNKLGGHPSRCVIILNGDSLEYNEDFVSINSNSLITKKYELFTCDDILEAKIKDVDFSGKALLVDKLNNDVLKKLKKLGVANILTLVKSDTDYLSLKQINKRGIVGDFIDAEKFIMPNSNCNITYLNPKVSDEYNFESIKKEGVGHKLLRHIGFIELPFINKETTLNPSNILALIPGKILDSTIVISAHYDHLGIINGKVYPGANDNASGVSGVIEIAGALNKCANINGSPKYNILFVFFSAEEKGTIGSRYFVNNSPYSIDKTVANINLDMIGSKDIQHDSISNFIYAYGPKATSLFLMQKINSINNQNDYLSLDFFEGNLQVGNKFLRLSDQINFIRKDIPVLFLFNGLSPNYHRITDTPDKIDYKKMENVCNLVVALIKDMAFDL